MPSKQPFARRIVIAFTLMTLIVSGLFSLGIVGIVHSIEEHLVSEELDRELNTILQDLGQGLPPRLDSSTQFFATTAPEFAIPLQFSRTQPGFTEVVNGDEAFYVYTRNVGNERYLLVQEQHEFEAREQALFNVVLAGFLLTIAGAWLLGRMMAQKVMAPVSRLAQQVQHRDQLHSSAPALAPEYADDEIGHLASAFDSTLGQLRRSLEREQLFTSDVSHELRTPLMIIGTSCELLDAAPLGAREKEQVARIARAAAEMRDLVQTFLTLARSQPEEASLAGTTTLASVAAEQYRRWGPAMAEKGLGFELLEEGTGAQRYNHTLLSTVMSNLLRNALHYTDAGWVRLTLEPGGFRVEDSGMGIPSGQQERIFEPFVRGERARGEGLGLGLSLVKRICTHQGWSIGVSDLAPGGSCFRVVLGQSPNQQL